MLGRRSQEHLAKAITTRDLYAEFSEYAGRYLLNSANAGQKSKISYGVARAGDVDSIRLRTRLIEMADKNEYVSARTHSKARLETNEVIMSKAHEEGGDMTSSERLASAFLCRRRIPGVMDSTPRVASMAASMASRVCGT